MKNFKKTLAFVVAVATLGTVSAIPANAVLVAPAETTPVESTTSETTSSTPTTGTVTKIGSLSSEERLVIDKNDLIDGMHLLINVTDPDGNLAFQLYAYTQDHTFSSSLSSTGYITVENEFYLSYVDEDTDLSEVNEEITVSFENPNKVVPVYLLNDAYPYYYCYYDQNEIMHLEGGEDTTDTTTTTTTEVTTTENGSNSLYDSEWFAENAITEAIIHLDDAGENSGTYYFKTPSNEPNIDISSLSEEDLATLNKGFPVKIDDYSIDTSAVENVLYVDKSHNEYIPIDFSSTYTNMYYNYSLGDWLMLTIYIPKVTTDNTTTTTETEPTIGDSDSTEPSETTLQRGDVNGDGTINALDLLQLKKYILGIIDSLD